MDDRERVLQIAGALLPHFTTDHTGDQAATISLGLAAILVRKWKKWNLDDLDEDQPVTPESA